MHVRYSCERHAMPSEGRNFQRASVRLSRRRVAQAWKALRKVRHAGKGRSMFWLHLSASLQLMRNSRCCNEEPKPVAAMLIDTVAPGRSHESIDSFVALWRCSLVRGTFFATRTEHVKMRRHLQHIHPSSNLTLKTLAPPLRLPLPSPLPQHSSKQHRYIIWQRSMYPTASAAECSSTSIDGQRWHLRVSNLLAMYRPSIRKIAAGSLTSTSQNCQPPPSRAERTHDTRDNSLLL